MTLMLCRQCCAAFTAGDGDGGVGAPRCSACGSSRLLRHPELFTLAIAHIDCDAFYASVEKRDDPSLVDRPVIVGGGRRGVVAACCYIARTHGVHSAMPMFQARKVCPDAVVIRPNIKKYSAVGQEIRTLMRTVTPLVEPLSIDEAFLDLGGTERLHGASPAETLARLIRRIEREVGVTASVGLSYNKFLAKIASDLDKPRGFAVIGRAEALDFLAAKPVGMIWGVGPALQKKLRAGGISEIGQLRALDEAALVARYGSIGRRLHHFAHGEDGRRVTPDRPAKSVSAETTFETDISGLEPLKSILWPLCEKVSARLKKAGLTGRAVTLKLKTAKFRTITRSRRLAAPTQLAETIWRQVLPLLEGEIGQAPFRLIGVGSSDLADTGETVEPADLVARMDPAAGRREQVERAIDSVRASFGDAAIVKGRSLKAGRGKP